MLTTVGREIPKKKKSRRIFQNGKKSFLIERENFFNPFLSEKLSFEFLVKFLRTKIKVKRNYEINVKIQGFKNSSKKLFVKL